MLPISFLTLNLTLLGVENMYQVKFFLPEITSVTNGHVTDFTKTFFKHITPIKPTKPVVSKKPITLDLDLDQTAQEINKRVEVLDKTNNELKAKLSKCYGEYRICHRNFQEMQELYKTMQRMLHKCRGDEQYTIYEEKVLNDMLTDESFKKIMRRSVIPPL